MEIFAYAENYTKTSNIKDYRQAKQDKATGGVDRPHHALTDVAALVACHQYIHVSEQENTLQNLLHTIDPKMVQDQRLKISITWIVGPTFILWQ